MHALLKIAILFAALVPLSAHAGLFCSHESAEAQRLRIEFSNVLLTYDCVRLGAAHCVAIRCATNTDINSQGLDELFHELARLDVEEEEEQEILSFQPVYDALGGLGLFWLAGGPGDDSDEDVSIAYSFDGLNSQALDALKTALAAWREQLVAEEQESGRSERRGMGWESGSDGDEDEDEVCGEY